MTFNRWGKNNHKLPVLYTVVEARLVYFPLSQTLYLLHAETTLITNCSGKNTAPLGSLGIKGSGLQLMFSQTALESWIDSCHFPFSPLKNEANKTCLNCTLSEANYLSI